MVGGLAPTAGLCRVDGTTGCDSMLEASDTSISANACVRSKSQSRVVSWVQMRAREARRWRGADADADGGKVWCWESPSAPRPPASASASITAVAGPPSGWLSGKGGHWDGGGDGRWSCPSKPDPAVSPTSIAAASDGVPDDSDADADEDDDDEGDDDDDDDREADDKGVKGFIDAVAPFIVASGAVATGGVCLSFDGQRESAVCGTTTDAAPLLPEGAGEPPACWPINAV
ncbi:hypothetical protein CAUPRSCDRAFT_12462 [Caulochytrium protostelioides]|uniref:Uncharacterized protein n=1 Tax=Caulochytrium protostelioides TaxID=1555241 RepID=A0A4P9WRN7_9FUNG|nr:hypothetical protein CAUPRSCDRAFT_12462 [Caulochytrium protostelioides]